jgi:hypothetical protein
MKRKRLTYNSKNVWSDILNNCKPIDMYGFPISEECMLHILKNAIANGLIITETHYTWGLELFRSVLHVYVPEKVLVNLLYRMDVPVYYESLGCCAGKMRYRFYAPIQCWNIDKLNIFIANRIDEYVEECYNNYWRRVILYRQVGGNRNEN